VERPNYVIFFLNKKNIDQMHLL